MKNINDLIYYTDEKIKEFMKKVFIDQTETFDWDGLNNNYYEIFDNYEKEDIDDILDFSSIFEPEEWYNSYNEVSLYFEDNNIIFTGHDCKYVISKKSEDFLKMLNKIFEILKKVISKFVDIQKALDAFFEVKENLQVDDEEKVEINVENKLL